jgi:hypothetical protein
MLSKSVSLSMKMQALPDDTCRLLATWTIPHLDKRGVFYGDPVVVKSLVLPMRSDVTVQQVQTCIEAMVSAGLILLFDAGGRRWQAWPGFKSHQVGLRDDRESTDFPAPPQGDASTAPDEAVQDAGNLPEECRKPSGEKPVEEEEKEKGKGKEVKSLSLSGPNPNGVDVMANPPAISEYIQTFGELPNDEQRYLILETITDLDKWRTVLKDWKAHKWNENNVPGMVDKYRFGDSRKRKDAPPRKGEQNSTQRRNAHIVRS